MEYGSTHSIPIPVFCIMGCYGWIIGSVKIVHKIEVLVPYQLVQGLVSGDGPHWGAWWCTYFDHESLPVAIYGRL